MLLVLLSFAAPTGAAWCCCCCWCNKIGALTTTLLIACRLALPKLSFVIVDATTSLAFRSDETEVDAIRAIFSKEGMFYSPTRVRTRDFKKGIVVSPMRDSGTVTTTSTSATPNDADKENRAAVVAPPTATFSVAKTDDRTDKPTSTTSTIAMATTTTTKLPPSTLSAIPTMTATTTSTTTTANANDQNSKNETKQLAEIERLERELFAALVLATKLSGPFRQDIDTTTLLAEARAGGIAFSQACLGSFLAAKLSTTRRT